MFLYNLTKLTKLFIMDFGSSLIHMTDVIQSRSSFQKAMYGIDILDKNDDNSEEHLNIVIRMYEHILSEYPYRTNIYDALMKGLEIEKDLLTCVKLNNNAKSAHKKK